MIINRVVLEKDANWEKHFAYFPVDISATRQVWLSYYETRVYTDDKGYHIKETRLPGDTHVHQVLLNGE